MWWRSGTAPRRRPRALPSGLAAPSLDEGPHLNYAIQWFLFAAIALGGASLMIYRDRKAPA